MEYLSMGQTREEWRDFPDGYILSYDSWNGMTLYFFLREPTPEILRQIGGGSAFAIGLADIRRVGFFTLRFGNLPWGDCAFAPNLFAPPSPIQPPPAGHGLPLNVIVIDSSLGAIVGMDSIVLGHDFSVQFANWFSNRMTLDLSPEDYRAIVRDTYQRYNTDALRNLANISWEKS